jgi:hypothetical protein
MTDVAVYLLGSIGAPKSGPLFVLSWLLAGLVLGTYALTKVVGWWRSRR